MGGGGSGGTTTSCIEALGKKLFFDENLSSDGNQSCASCHDPNFGFADPDGTDSNYQGGQFLDG
ncbi:MAG: hypothetical protein GY784_02940 [Gammaproteobacteria bacterium]|nr:hypothetical protein [Gammaproteobacteria bacterium]